MVYESVIEESIISLLQKKGYELIDENDNWILNRTLDEFINEDLLKECLEVRIMIKFTKYFLKK